MIGSSDLDGNGSTYDSHFDRLIDNPSFSDRAAPVEKAISSGSFDPVGDNYTDFKSPVGASTEATGALKGADPILPSGAFQSSSLGTVEDNVMPLNAQLVMMEKKKIPEGIRGGESSGGSSSETIKGAAIKSGDKVYEGTSHFDIVAKNRNMDLDSATSGFVTSTGRFVSREEALQIHYAGKTPIRERDHLISEDLLTYRPKIRIPTR